MSEMLALAERLELAASNTDGCLYSQRKMLTDAATALRARPDPGYVAGFEACREALANVNKLISEAAMTGFNCHDGDWAKRLFESQQKTSRALKLSALPAPAPAAEVTVEELADWLGHLDVLRIAGSVNDDEAELARTLLSRFHITAKATGVRQ